MTDGPFYRVAGTDRETVKIIVDGEPIDALAGDTVLTALLTTGRRLGRSDFGDGARAGFCLMGACQDCWIRLEGGGQLRACTTFVSEGLRLRTGTNAP